MTNGSHTDDAIEWLDGQIERSRRRFDEAESDAQAYQLAAEAETYLRIKSGTLPFGGPKEALEVYEREVGQTPDFGMTAARIRAIERYLDEWGGREGDDDE